MMKSNLLLSKVGGAVLLDDGLGRVDEGQPLRHHVSGQVILLE